MGREIEAVLAFPEDYPGHAYRHRAYIELIGRAVGLIVIRLELEGVFSLIDSVVGVSTLLSRSLNANGTCNSDNYASPPDTGFCVESVGALVRVLRRDGREPLQQLCASLERYITCAMPALVAGGVHTPNHRWVVSSALAYAYEVSGDEQPLRRIERWLREGIDIDGDGQFSERSSGIYTPVTLHALIRIADILNRPSLLDAVRTNLATLPFYLRSDGLVETIASRRQDYHSPAVPRNYIFPLRYIAALDGNARYRALAKVIERQFPLEGWRSALFQREFPVLERAVSDGPPPELTYAHHFRGARLYRERTSHRCLTLYGGNDKNRLHVSGKSRNPSFLNLRVGKVAIEALRMAPHFFDLGYFLMEQRAYQGGVFTFEDEVSAAYYDPLSAEQLDAGGGYELSSAEERYWSKMSFPARSTSFASHVMGRCRVIASERRITVEVETRGARRVPVALEFVLSPGSEVGGDLSSPPPFFARANRRRERAFFTAGGSVTVRRGGDLLRIESEASVHDWTPMSAESGEIFPEVREDDENGALRLYVTRFTPLHERLVIHT